MRRIFHAVLLGLVTLTLVAHAQTGRVQTIADVSFAVPDGWAYEAATDFSGMAYKEGNRFWFIGVYASIPTSGDPVADFKAAWKSIVLNTGKYKDYPGWGTYSTYEMPKTVGYSGRFNDDASVDKTQYARAYVLETGKSFIPVLSLSGSREMMDSMNYMELAVVGSVRPPDAAEGFSHQTSDHRGRPGRALGLWCRQHPELLQRRGPVHR